MDKDLKKLLSTLEDQIAAEDDEAAAISASGLPRDAFVKLPQRGCDPALFAASRGMPKTLASCLARGSAPDCLDVGGDGLLVHAASSGSLDCLQICLAAGAPMAAYMRMPPLHMACRRGRPLLVRALLQAGADPNQTNSRGLGPHFQAIIDRTGACLEELIKGGCHLETPKEAVPFEHACASNPAALALAAKAGAPLGGLDMNGSNALFLAILAREPQSVQLLVDAGVDPELKNDFGQTPIGEAQKILRQSSSSTPFEKMAIDSIAHCLAIMERSCSETANHRELAASSKAKSL